MSFKMFVVWALSAASLPAQSKFSWQDSCFKNPGLPYCQGRDFAVKPPPPPPPPSPTVVRGTGQNRSGNQTSTGPATLMTIGAIDWRFADPMADVLVGMNFSRIAASPLAKGLISQFAAKQGLTDADVEKIFDSLSGVDQLALSMRNNRVVAMITGSSATLSMPPSEPGEKSAVLPGGALLIGHSDAVDEAMQRIQWKRPLTELTQSAEARQATAELWAIAPGAIGGPQAVSTGLRRLYLMVWLRDKLTTDVALDFNGVANPNALHAWQSKLGPSATVEGNTVHLRTAMDSAELKQRFAEIAASPVGQPLGALIQAARSLPSRDLSQPKRTKPVIYGLDGGPKEVQ
jgi:hypothetical protein